MSGLTDGEIALVRESYGLALRKQHRFAGAFYDKLFHDHPFVRALFSDDMHEQEQSLIATLNVVVAGLHDLTPLLPTVRELARRHVRYGVRESHYPIVGAALVDSFADTLEAAFTVDMRSAWTAAYAVVADTMIAAAYPPQASTLASAG